MLIPPASPRIFLFVAGSIASTLIIGCTEISPPVVAAQSSSYVATVITTDELLSRSATAHQRLSTLRATGVFRDHRRGGQRVVPIRWELARPDRCRLQIDMDVAIVLKDEWWTYRADTGRFQSHRLFTRTPIDTAGTLMSDGIAFPLPALFLRGEAALHADARIPSHAHDSSSRFSGWRLLGAGWSGTIPCYVFERTEAGADPPSVMMFHIDQASLLLRGWSLEQVHEDGRRRLLLEVSYIELVPDAALSPDTFQLNHPQPIALPAGTQRASPP